MLMWGIPRTELRTVAVASAGVGGLADVSLDPAAGCEVMAVVCGPLGSSPAFAGLAFAFNPESFLSPSITLVGSTLP